MGISHSLLSSPNTCSRFRCRPTLNPFLSGPPTKMGTEKASGRAQRGGNTHEEENTVFGPPAPTTPRVHVTTQFTVTATRNTRSLASSSGTNTHTHKHTPPPSQITRCGAREMCYTGDIWGMGDLNVKKKRKKEKAVPRVDLFLATNQQW